MINKCLFAVVKKGKLSEDMITQDYRSKNVLYMTILNDC